MRTAPHHTQAKNNDRHLCIACAEDGATYEIPEHLNVNSCNPGAAARAARAFQLPGLVRLVRMLSQGQVGQGKGRTRMVRLARQPSARRPATARFSDWKEAVGWSSLLLHVMRMPKS